MDKKPSAIALYVSDLVRGLVYERPEALGGGIETLTTHEYSEIYINHEARILDVVVVASDPDAPRLLRAVKMAIEDIQSSGMWPLKFEDIVSEQDQLEGVGRVVELGEPSP